MMDDNNRNSILFYKIYRNKYLYRIINEHIRNFIKIDEFSKLKKFSFNSMTLNKFKYRDYLKTIHFNSSNSTEYDPFILQDTSRPIKEYKKDQYLIDGEMNDTSFYSKIPASCTRLIYHDNKISGEFQSYFLSDSIHSLTTLEFGDDFNKPIKIGYFDNLLALTTIVFGNNFNSLIENGSIPTTVKVLKFGFAFNNKSINEGCLSDCNRLNELEFGQQYNTQLKSFVLPTRLTSIKFGTYYNEPIQFASLPKDLEILKLGFSFNHKLTSNLIPTTLTELSFGYHYNFKFDENLLPLSLTYLKLPQRYNHQLSSNTLPPGLKTLIIGELYDHPLPTLPPTLEKLSFNLNSIFNHSLLNNLPTTLVSLSLGRSFRNLVNPNLACLTFLKYPYLQTLYDPNEIQHLIKQENKNYQIKNKTKCIIN